MKAMLAGVGVVTLAACYTSRPLQGPPPPSARVVARLTDSGVVAMATAIGAGAVEVEGIVQAADAESWALQMLRVEYRSGQSTTWNRESVVFPRYALTQPAERTLSRGKSWLAAGSIVALAVIAAGVAGALASGDNDGGDPPPPN